MSISLFRSVSGQYEDLREVNSVSVMNTISRVIEDQIIDRKLSVNFYAGFQRFSHFPDQLRRYSRLGAVCRRVYVFGIADYEPPVIPGVEFVEISPGSALAREWFLLVDTPDFWTTLVSQEIEGPDLATGGRCFDGVWSFNEHIVDRLALLIAQFMESTYMPVQRRNYEQQSLHITEINTRLLNLLEKAELTSQRRWKQLHTLQQLAETGTEKPSNLLQDAASIVHTTFGAAGVVITLCNSSEHYIVAAAEGEANGKGKQVPIAEGLTGQAIQQGRLIHVDEIRHKEEADPLLPTARSLITAPILNRRVHGAITVSNTKPHRWNGEDTSTIMAIARNLAIHLEQGYSVFNLKLLRKTTQELQQALTRQQGPIARLLALQQKLQTQGGLTPHQIATLHEMNETSTALAQTIKITLTTGKQGGA